MKLQCGKMDILTRYGNVDRMLAETKYLDSQFPDGATAQQLLEKFGLGTKDIDQKHFLQI